MDFNKAIRILELTNNFTEEELRKAYRKLIVKYHPDKYESKSDQEKKYAEEKTKEINAAKEFLEKTIEQQMPRYTNSNNSSRTTDNNATFKKSKDSFVNEIDNYNTELTNLINSKKINELNTLKTIEKLIKLNHEYKLKIINIENMDELNLLKFLYKISIQNELKEFLKEYCKKYNMNTDILKFEKYSLKILYEQLEKIRKQQNIIEASLNPIEEKYKLVVGYDIIKENLQKSKAIIIQECINGLCNIDKAVSTFEKIILDEFKEYYRRLEVINKFKNLGLKDKMITIVIDIMEKCIIEDKITFNIFEKKVTKLIEEKENKKENKVFKIDAEDDIYNYKRTERYSSNDEKFAIATYRASLLRNKFLPAIEKEYSLSKGYGVIKEKIEEIKIQLTYQYQNHLLYKGYLASHEVITSFEKMILEEFREYYRRLEVIKYFKSLSFTDEIIVNNIDLMEKNITAQEITFQIYEYEIRKYIKEKTKKESKKPTNLFNLKRKKKKI